MADEDAVMFERDPVDVALNQAGDSLVGDDLKSAIHALIGAVQELNDRVKERDTELEERFYEVESATADLGQKVAKIPWE